MLNVEQLLSDDNNLMQASSIMSCRRVMSNGVTV